MQENSLAKQGALDKVINITQGGPSGDFKVTGVFKDSYKSHLIANFFVSMTSTGWGAYIRTDPEASNEWGGNNFVPAYVKLAPGHNKATVEKKMNDILIKYGAEDMKALGLTKTLGLEPVKDIYLRSDIHQSPRIIYLYVIASIAVFILLIGCINFMNLSTAKASKRAGEMGIRKAMGAFRSSLIRQILGEAMVIVLISMLVSVVMVQMTLPFFNQLTGKTISFGTENIYYFVLALASIAIITGIVAGSYPAFYLSSFQPAQVLKGKFNLGNASGWLRRTLVVFQFMIAITLVCGMLIISHQLRFMQDKDLGFDSHAKIILPLRTHTAQNNYDGLLKEFQKNSAVKLVSGAEYVPGSTIWSDMAYYTEGGNMEKAILNRRNRVDYGYLELMEIKLIAGRSFTNNRPMESQNKIIINRAATRKFGFEPEQMIGQRLYFDWQGQQYSHEVIGVMEDYHQNSLKEEINPVLFEMSSESTRYDFLVASVTTGNFDNTISSLETTWKSLVTDTPFEYSFLDETIQKQYDEDRKVSSIITCFTFIAMAICCLGLYGLSTYMAERRIKEIGVRKVLGASIKQIVAMMSTEFVKLVVLAFVISMPIAWYAMNRWLEGFAYREPIHLTVFVYAGVTALAIALLTVGFESVKAASANPVNSLRNE